jgi:hypothetical protein
VHTTAARSLWCPRISLPAIMCVVAGTTGCSRSDLSVSPSALPTAGAGGLSTLGSARQTPTAPECIASVRPPTCDAVLVEGMVVFSGTQDLGHCGTAEVYVDTPPRPFAGRTYLGVGSSKISGVSGFPIPFTVCGDYADLRAWPGIGARFGVWARVYLGERWGDTGDFVAVDWPEVLQGGPSSTTAPIPLLQSSLKM